MTNKERKEAIDSILLPYLKERGYKKNTDGPNTFYINRLAGVYHSFYYHVNSYGEIDNSLIGVSIRKIEEVIIEIGFPNISETTKLLLKENKKNNFHNTVSDSSYNLSYFEKRKLEQRGMISSHSDAVEYANSAIEYLEIKGFPFAEWYSYIPNILEEINNLHLQGKYWTELLDGVGSDYLFKGLLISKLCNDPKYFEKESYVEKELNSEVYYAKYLPYFEKAKELIKAVEPIYNL